MGDEMILIILFALIILTATYAGLKAWTADNRYGYEIFGFGKVLINVVGIASIALGIIGLPAMEGFAPLLFGCIVLGLQWIATCKCTSGQFGSIAFIGLTLFSAFTVILVVAALFVGLAAQSCRD